MFSDHNGMKLNINNREENEGNGGFVHESSVWQASVKPPHLSAQSSCLLGSDRGLWGPWESHSHDSLITWGPLYRKLGFPWLRKAKFQEQTTKRKLCCFLWSWLGKSHGNNFHNHHRPCWVAGKQPLACASLWEKLLMSLEVAWEMFGADSWKAPSSTLKPVHT